MAVRLRDPVSAGAPERRQLPLSQARFGEAGANGGGGKLPGVVAVRKDMQVGPHQSTQMSV